MKQNLFILTLLSCLFLLPQSCLTQPDETAQWKLGWRMVASYLDEDLEQANQQFDSLLAQPLNLSPVFWENGLEVKQALGLESEVTALLAKVNSPTLQALCRKANFQGYSACRTVEPEKVGNPDLQLALIRMYLDDQAARGSIDQEIVVRYQIDPKSISEDGAVGIDERNRNRLKEIIAEFGFPSRALVGQDAMVGVFFIIQHADGDPDWQRAQLPYIEEAVQRGDLQGQSYAYLYDRIQVKRGNPQRYGTQFAKVDPIHKIAELAPVENPETLDQRRRAFGMMPIAMYKEFVFKAY